MRDLNLDNIGKDSRRQAAGGSSRTGTESGSDRRAEDEAESGPAGRNAAGSTGAGRAGSASSAGRRAKAQAETNPTAKSRARAHRRGSSSQIILLGFLSVILTGTLLLMLPFSSKAQGSVGFFNALFTATSATCVTGLVVLDTATTWTLFGQAVILLLIQVGGMGVVTISIAISVIARRRIGLSERSTMQASISAPQVGGIVKFTKFILFTTAVIELTGAALLAPVFIRDFGFARGLWYSLFHAVSAFCNAGFDLMGVNGPFSSMTAYAANPYVNLVLMALIVIGGLGFLSWHDLKENGRHWSRYRIQTKVVFSVTAVLIIVPTLYFFLCEYQDLPAGQRLLASAFSSVTARTAGFNTVDFGEMSETGQMAMIILMIIGGSSGSTAGGMKTTTVAVLLFSALSLFRQQQSTHLFRRRIPEETVRSAATLLLMYVVTSIFGAMAISSLEGVPMMTALFETSSAVATVGLSLGLTPSLHLPSRLIIIFLMYIGRVGGLTIIFAAVQQRKGNEERYPVEKITVG